MRKALSQPKSLPRPTAFAVSARKLGFVATFAPRLCPAMLPNFLLGLFLSVSLSALLSVGAMASTERSPEISPSASAATASLTTGDGALQPATTGGVEALDRALAKLSTHRRLLVVAAHPDDEDTAVLSYVSRHLGGEAAYLSLSRGEGGQNLIGQELGVGLGLIRSGELLRARSIDGGRQFFTRAYDFGYTRSLEETFQRWPREVLLEDGLRVVRRFKPQVIVAVFPGDERAGHGQHQASGVIARQLFETSGDATTMPALADEGLFPWTVEALYRSGWWSREEEANRFSLGVLDPHRGKTVVQIARESRSSHRSQDMGGLEPLGSVDHRLLAEGGVAKNTSGAESGTETGAESGPFAGIDTRLRALAAALGDEPRRATLEQALDLVEARARQARARLSPGLLGAGDSGLTEDLTLILEQLRAAHTTVVDDEQGSAGAAVRELLDEKLAIAEEARATAAGIAADAYTTAQRLTPGSQLIVEAPLFNGSHRPIDVRRAKIFTPNGWVVQTLAADGSEAPTGVTFADAATGLTLEPLTVGLFRFQVTVPPDEPPTLPYFLHQPLQGDLYDWSLALPAQRSEPFQAPLLRVGFSVSAGNGEDPVTLVREVIVRDRDQAFGEIRTPLRIVPTVEISVGPELVVRDVEDSSAVILEVRLAHRGTESDGGDPLDLAVEINSPALTHTLQRTTTLASAAQRALAIELPLRSDLTPGRYEVQVTASAGDQRWSRSVPLVDYPHVRPRARPVAAVTEIAVGDFTLPRLRAVGYVRGASDRVPEALSHLGLPLTELGPEDLEVGDLDRFDAIVVGSRAYETDAALRDANPRLLEYARRGGTVIVQYQQYQFSLGGFAPFELEIHRPHDRVTDETSPVTVLEPNHPALRHPNLISDADWQGWVQERGLYFPGQWGDEFQPLLEMEGASGEPQQGGLLVAALGEGTYVYTGLAFFRQLPAGVVGAYRLLLNLLALAEDPSLDPAPAQSSE